MDEDIKPAWEKPAAKKRVSFFPEDHTDNTAEKQRGRPFQPGQSGNPNGRPKGSKNRLADKFVSALISDFDENGADAVEKLRDLDPLAYLQLIKSVVPKVAFHREAEAIDCSSWSQQEFTDFMESERKKCVVRNILQSYEK